MGALPADGNYEFTTPASAFSPSASADAYGTDYFLLGDLDRNRVVGFNDMLILGNWFDETATDRTFAQGDFDSDGDIDQDDFDLLGARWNTRLAPAPSYEGEVTVSSLAVQTDGSSPLVVNWAPISDATIQASDPSNANKTISGYSVYRSIDGVTFEKIAEVARPATNEPTVYGYTDDTPLDGTKYWYRIRPFYDVTMPDGTTSHQHLPTTNKAWRVSALRAPSLVDATYAGNTMFVSWKDESAGETGFEVQMPDGNGGWVTVATAATNANSVGINLTALPNGVIADESVRVVAVQSVHAMTSAAALGNSSQLTAVPDLHATISRRELVESHATLYNYDAGIEFSGHTIQVFPSPTGSNAITTGTYTVGVDGIVALPLDPTRSLNELAIQRVLIGTSRDGIVVTETYQYRPLTPVTVDVDGTTGKGTGRGEIVFPGNQREPPEGLLPDPSGPIVPIPPTAPTPLPTIKVIEQAGAYGRIHYTISVTFTPPPGPPNGRYTVPLIVIDANGNPVPIQVTVIVE